MSPRLEQNTSCRLTGNHCWVLPQIWDLEKPLQMRFLSKWDFSPAWVVLWALSPQMSLVLVWTVVSISQPVCDTTLSLPNHSASLQEKLSWRLSTKCLHRTPSLKSLARPGFTPFSPIYLLVMYWYGRRYLKVKFHPQLYLLWTI